MPRIDPEDGVAAFRRLSAFVAEKGGGDPGSRGAGGGWRGGRRSVWVRTLTVFGETFLAGGGGFSHRKSLSFRDGLQNGVSMLFLGLLRSTIGSL